MSKELIQDIKQPKRRLADVLPKARELTPDSLKPIVERRRSRKVWIFILILILVGGLFYFGSRWLAKAVVIITPKQTNIVIDDTLRAVTATKTKSAGAIGFQTMTVKRSEQATVTATEKVTTSGKASGSIIVSNLFSPEPQPLIANTRFQTETGKIYRIQKAVSVPGYVKKDGQIVAGELEVVIYADEPGPDYNGEVEKLTIPGFKDGPRYSKITAQGKTALTGGTLGEQLAVSPTVRSTTEAKLMESLRATLRLETDIGLPEGYISYPELMMIEFETQIKDGEGANELIIETTGEATSVIFSRTELSRQLALRHLANSDNGDVLIDNLDELTVSRPGGNDWDANNLEEVDIHLRGAGQLVWQFDETALKNSLIGVKESTYESVLLAYPNLTKIEVEMRPSWLKRFPTDVQKIDIRLGEVDQ